MPNIFIVFFFLLENRFPADTDLIVMMLILFSRVYCFRLRVNMWSGRKDNHNNSFSWLSERIRYPKMNAFSLGISRELISFIYINQIGKYR